MAGLEEEGLTAGLQLPRAAENIVEQEMIAHRRAELVHGTAVLPAKLIQVQVYETLILKHVEADLALGLNRQFRFHLCPSCCHILIHAYSIYQNAS